MANGSIDMHNITSSAEIIDIIRASVETLIDNPELAHAIPPIMLRGAPGVGKSTIVRTIAEELGIEFRDIRLAEMERVDIAGLPSVENGKTNWNVPAIWPQDPKSKGIILLDEITAAPADVQVAAYQIVLDRAIANSNYKLPDGWFIVAAGNRIEDRAVAKPMSSALANRFSHFELEANSSDWSSWAVKHDIHPSVTGFIQYRPHLLHLMEKQNLEMGWPSPRSWERVSNVISIYDHNIEVLRKVVFGLIGNQVGTEFMAYHKIGRKFANVLEMLTNPKAEIVVPTKADEKHAIASAVSYLLWNGTSQKDDKLRIEGMFRIIDKMPPDFATVIIKHAMLGNKRVSSIEAAKMISKSKSYEAYKAKYGIADNKKKIAA